MAGVLGHRSFLGNDWKEQVRRPLRIAIDLVNYRLARADVIRDVFDPRHCAGAGGDIHACDVQADSVPGLV